MSIIDCVSKKCGIVLVENRRRQFIYTILVTTCSITTGMCMEWTCFFATDEKTNDTNTDYIEKYGLQLVKSCLYFGMIFSAGPAAFVASLIGLKSLLMAGTLITISGSIVCNLGTYLAMYIGRSLHGIGAGIVFVIVPNYGAEIAEPKFRNALAGLHYVQLLIGQLLSHVANQHYDYPYINMGIIIMAILNLIALLNVHDPPYYRLKLKKQTNALDFKLKIHDNSRSTICNNIYRSLKTDDDDNKNGIDLSSIITEQIYWRPLLVNVFLICIQQFCGLSWVLGEIRCLYDTIPIISDTIPAMITTISLQIVSCIVCLLIVGVTGKIHLLITSGFGMAVILSVMNVAYYKDTIDDDEPWLLSLFVIYIIFYSIGYGPIPWILMPEICPRNSRLWTCGVIVSLYALLNIIINQPIYEYVRFVYGIDIFILIFTLVSFTGGGFAYRHIEQKLHPETIENYII